VWLCCNSGMTVVRVRLWGVVGGVDGWVSFCWCVLGV